MKRKENKREHSGCSEFGMTLTKERDYDTRHIDRIQMITEDVGRGTQGHDFLEDARN
jgi:hypothetical protein